jgi:hypothetical protein
MYHSRKTNKQIIAKHAKFIISKEIESQQNLKDLALFDCLNHKGL